ncbi:MAG: hypothetical protein L3J37_12095 [Rhodobacteraceae bacterium]|nr:hypothetical protein [Paracoccaceae bacterium]
MKKFTGLSLLLLGACVPVVETMSRAEAIEMCQAEAAEAAKVVSGDARVGINSVSGPSLGFGIAINLTPKPPAQTFEACMGNLAANGQILEGM